MDGTIRFLRLWVLFGALELLLVGKLDPQETPVGIAVGALAALATVRVLDARGERYRPRAGWLALLPRIVFAVARDTLRVFGLLLRRLAGGPLPEDRIVELPFEAGGDDPESKAHRALAVAAVSSAPNSVALGVVRERGVIRVHYLDAAAPRPRSAEWPL